MATIGDEMGGARLTYNVLHTSLIWTFFDFAFSFHIVCTNRKIAIKLLRLSFDSSQDFYFNE